VLAQLFNVFQDFRTSLVAVQVVTLDHVKRYGRQGKRYDCGSKSPGSHGGIGAEASGGRAGVRRVLEQDGLLTLVKLSVLRHCCIARATTKCR
jgi:hypothetical protein